MINHVLFVLGRRPGKHEKIVTLAVGNLSRRSAVDLFNGNVVDNYSGVVLLAPLFGEYALEPRVILA
jgi:hypothetical protein